MILKRKSDGTPLEDKRKELSRIVRRAGNIIQKGRLRTTWDVCSNGTNYHCGHVTLGGKGNIITLYTPEDEARKKRDMGFDAVVVYILNEKYWRLGYKISNKLMRAGYETSARHELDDRILGCKE